MVASSFYNRKLWTGTVHDCREDKCMYMYVWILGREQAVKQDVPIKFFEGQKVRGLAKLGLQLWSTRNTECILVLSFIIIILFVLLLILLFPILPYDLSFR
jgi:hypothetical protein